MCFKGYAGNSFTLVHKILPIKQFRLPIIINLILIETMAKKVNEKNTRTQNIPDKNAGQLKSAMEIPSSRGDRIAIWVANILGSLTFLLVCLSALLLYFLWNMNVLPGLHAFDPYPFSVLDVVLSVFAIVLSISVLISQNRQRRVEKTREQVEFEVNIRAENEITKMLEMLHAIQQKLGINKPDPELEQMKETIDIEELHKNIGENKQ